MNSYISLLGSIVIGGLVLLSLNNFTMSFTNDYNDMLQSFETTNDLNYIITVMSDDFNRIGYGLERQEDAIISFGLDHIRFRGDVDNDGVVEEVYYSLSDTTELSSTFNPSDKILYRTIGDDKEVPLAFGIKDFRLTGYNFPEGQLTTNTTKIKTIGVELEVQSSFPVNDRYAKTYWRTRFSPPNLRRY